MSCPLTSSSKVPLQWSKWWWGSLHMFQNKWLNWFLSRSCLLTTKDLTHFNNVCIWFWSLFLLFIIPLQAIPKWQLWRQKGKKIQQKPLSCYFIQMIHRRDVGNTSLAQLSVFCLFPLLLEVHQALLISSQWNGIISWKPTLLETALRLSLHWVVQQCPDTGI